LEVYYFAHLSICRQSNESNAAGLWLRLPVGRTTHNASQERAGLRKPPVRCRCVRDRVCKARTSHVVACSGKQNAAPATLCRCWAQGPGHAKDWGQPKAKDWGHPKVKSQKQAWGQRQAKGQRRRAKGQRRRAKSQRRRAKGQRRRAKGQRWPKTEGQSWDQGHITCKAHNRSQAQRTRERLHQPHQVRRSQRKTKRNISHTTAHSGDEGGRFERRPCG
jgi:hypothetical protein